ncbi:MAG: DegV family protein [Chloroflexi bacterium]|nr:DegV family protein [Chloroflexota bacterium]
MRRVKVVVDSGADLPPELVQRYDIQVVPLRVTLGLEDVSHLHASPERFWQQALASGRRPATAAPSPEQVRRVFHSLVRAGYDVLAVTLTGKLSAVYESFAFAAREFPGRVAVVDSRSLSLGVGLVAWRAAQWAAEGMSLEDVRRAAEALRERVYVAAVLDTLDWAVHGGRIAYLLPVIRRVTRLFRVKVILRVDAGRVHLGGVQRTYARAVRMLEDQVLALGPVETLWIPHTRRPRQARTLAERLASPLGLPLEHILIREAGPVLGSHVGPGALGVALVMSNDERLKSND